MLSSPSKGPPASVEALQDQVLAALPGLPKRIRQCAEFAISNHEMIAFATVAEISDRAGVQPSAFMRFCSYFGFSGYSQLQRLVRTSLSPASTDYRTRLEKLRDDGALSAAAILAEFVEAGQGSLEALVQSVDPKTLERAVAKLKTANIIHIIGLGRAYAAATYLAYTLEKMGIACICHGLAGKVSYLNALHKGDAVLAISFAPYTSETVELVEQALQQQLDIVAITDGRLSPLSRDGIEVLNIVERDVGEFRSLAATLTLAIALAVAIGSHAAGDNDSHAADN